MNTSQKVLLHARRVAALALSAALAMGGMPAAAFADTGEPYQVELKENEALVVPYSATSPNDQTNVVVDGDVSTNSHAAVNASTQITGIKSVTAQVTGDVSNTDTSCSWYPSSGVVVDNINADATVSIGGDLSTESTSGSVTAGYLLTNVADSTLEVGGDASAVATDDAQNVAGIYASTRSNATRTSSTTIDVGGSVSADASTCDAKSAYGANLDMNGYYRSNVSLTVGGDLTATGGSETSAGLRLWYDDIQGSSSSTVPPVTVLVDGTIHGDTAGVSGYYFDSDGSGPAKLEDVLDLTTWKVETGEGGELFQFGGFDPSGHTQAVNYIVRKDEESQSLFDVLYQGNTLGTRTFGNRIYDIARQVWRSRASLPSPQD